MSWGGCSPGRTGSLPVSCQCPGWSVVARGACGPVAVPGPAAAQGASVPGGLAVATASSARAHMDSTVWRQKECHRRSWCWSRPNWSLPNCFLLRGRISGRTGHLPDFTRSAIDPHRAVTPQVLHQRPCPETAKLRTAATRSTTPTEICCKSSPSCARCNVMRRPGAPWRRKHSSTGYLFGATLIRMDKDTGPRRGSRRTPWPRRPPDDLVVSQLMITGRRPTLTRDTPDTP